MPFHQNDICHVPLTDFLTLENKSFFFNSTAPVFDHLSRLSRPQIRLMVLTPEHIKAPHLGCFDCLEQTYELKATISYLQPLLEKKGYSLYQHQEGNQHNAVQDTWIMNGSDPSGLIFTNAGSQKRFDWISFSPGISKRIRAYIQNRTFADITFIDHRLDAPAPAMKLNSTVTGHHAPNSATNSASLPERTIEYADRYTREEWRRVSTARVLLRDKRAEFTRRLCQGPTLWVSHHRKPAEIGDRVSIEYTESTKSKPPHQTQQRFFISTILGNNELIKGFEAQLIGLTKNQRKHFTLIKTEHQDKSELTAQPKTFNVRVTCVQSNAQQALATRTYRQLIKSETELSNTLMDEYEDQLAQQSGRFFRNIKRQNVEKEITAADLVNRTLAAPK